MIIKPMKHNTTELLHLGSLSSRPLYPRTTSVQTSQCVVFYSIEGCALPKLSSAIGVLVGLISVCFYKIQAIKRPTWRKVNYNVL